MKRYSDTMVSLLRFYASDGQLRDGKLGNAKTEAALIERGDLAMRPAQTPTGFSEVGVTEQGLAQLVMLDQSAAHKLNSATDAWVTSLRTSADTCGVCEGSSDVSVCSGCKIDGSAPTEPAEIDAPLPRVTGPSQMPAAIIPANLMHDGASEPQEIHPAMWHAYYVSAQSIAAMLANMNYVTMPDSGSPVEHEEVNVVPSQISAGACGSLLESLRTILNVIFPEDQAAAIYHAICDGETDFDYVVMNVIGEVAWSVERRGRKYAGEMHKYVTMDAEAGQYGDMEFSRTMLLAGAGCFEDGNGWRSPRAMAILANFHTWGARNRDQQGR